MVNTALPLHTIVENLGALAGECYQHGDVEEFAIVANSARRLRKALSQFVDHGDESIRQESEVENTMVV